MNAVFDTGGEEGRCGRGHVGCYRKRWGEIVEEYTMLGTRDIATRLVRTNHTLSSAVIYEYGGTNEGIIWGMCCMYHQQVSPEWL
jgi:hypothetical protein